MHLSPLKTSELPSTATQKERIHAVAQDFEAVFVGQMFSMIFKDIKPPGFSKPSNGERMFHKMLINEYAKTVVQTGGVGIADMIEKQLSSTQENGKEAYLKTLNRLQKDPALILEGQPDLDLRKGL